ncbi:MAG: hypothetical protein LBQ28_00610 [Prevotellaceae bacterium]|jgi:hypothetical protein|nr:hypothetical protein [Prevotellaceae bacterium]
MKKILKLTAMLLILAACNHSDDNFCTKLSEQGNIDYSSLLGDWQCQSFAYCSNSIDNAVNHVAILKGHISITDINNIWLYHTNEIHYDCILGKPNSMHLTLKGSTYINPTQEEIDITQALDSAVCYVIIGDKLFIHFNGFSNKNILIFTKYESN